EARSGWRPSGRFLDSPLHHLRKSEILSKQPGPPHRPARRKSENEPLLQGFLIFDLNDGKAAEPPQPLFETRSALQGHVQKDYDCRRHIGGKVLEDFPKCLMAARRGADDDQVRDVAWVRDVAGARLSLAPESFS